MKDVLALVHADITAIFGAILPGGEIVPKVRREDKNERVYLELEEFFGLKTPLNATPILSESYRNALAISVYLAAALNRTYGGRFIILDDLTSSFDGGNQMRLILAIYQRVARPQNANGVQTIVLSHDEFLQKEFDLLASEGYRWSAVNLHGSSPAERVDGSARSGPQINAAITEALTKGQLEFAKALVRQYLEFRLMEVIRKVQIPVPK